MMAAIAAAGHGRQVLLLERNEKLGKKLYITGKGRGNLTNASDIGEFFDKISTNSKFLYSALYGFSNVMLLDFLSEYGFSWKTERGGRVFPTSDHASDITKALTKALHVNGVEIRLGRRVKTLVTSGSNPNSIIGVQLSSGEVLSAGHVIVATGGKSYPATGSTGDGIEFADTLGLKTKKAFPALVPFETLESDIRALQGLTLRNVKLEIRKGGSCLVYDGFGEILFTHFGVSGPLVLAASSKVTKDLAAGETMDACIDLKPAISREQLDERLQRHASDLRQKHFSHFFDGLVPGKLRHVLLERCGVSPDQKICNLTRQERRSIVDLLKSFSFTVTGTRGFSEAIITQGGVCVKELNPMSMAVKRMKGLSFAGEVIDVDALTGGYNMQIAFSTGFAAGNALAFQ